MEIDGAIELYIYTDTEGIEEKRLDALISLRALIEQRVFPIEAPQGAELPYVTYIDVSDVKNHTHDGQDELESPIKQYTAHAATKAQAYAVAKLLKTALCDFSGVMSGIEVDYITLLNEFSSIEKTSDNSVTGYYTDLEFQIDFIRS